MKLVPRGWGVWGMGAVLVAMLLIAAACGGDDEGGEGTPSDGGGATAPRGGGGPAGAADTHGPGDRASVLRPPPLKLRARHHDRTDAVPRPVRPPGHGDWRRRGCSREGPWRTGGLRAPADPPP